MLEFILEDIIAYGLWEITEIVAVVVFTSNAISLWLPNHSRYKPIQWCLDILNRLSLNIHRNANRLQHTLERQEYDVEQAVERAIKKERQRNQNRFGGREP